MADDEDMQATGDFLQTVARGLDEALNGEKKGEDRETGWVLLTFGFGVPGIANYISNAKREDMITALREAANRIERNQDNRRF